MPYQQCVLYWQNHNNKKSSISLKGNVVNKQQIIILLHANTSSREHLNKHIVRGE